MKKIKELIKEYQLIIIFSIIACTILHLPLFTKTLLTGDILLNTNYYSGYAWEISLGRFGLYFYGLLKSFIVVPELEIILSILLITGSIILMLDLFKIKKKSLQLLSSLLIILSPIISCTLLFHYCSLPYSLAFFTITSAIYLLINSKNKICKYFLPCILTTLALSMYQAYLAIGLTLLLLYWMMQIIKKKFNWKKFFISFLIILLGTVFYYILMKLSLLITHVELSTYKGANTLGIKSLLEIPEGLLHSYQTFYDFYFTDNIVNTTNIGMNYLNFIFLLLLITASIALILRKKVSIKYILLFYLFLFLLPVTMNVITIIIPDTNMQILQGTAYLLLFFFLCYLINDNKVLQIIAIFLFIFMIRGYYIQDNATYKVLEQTYHKTYSIASDIKEKTIKIDYNKPVMIAGDISKNKYYMKKQTTELSQLSNLTYGYVSNYPLFWNEFTNMKNGWSRFMETYLGFPITFVDLDTYQKILETNEYKDMKIYPDKDSIQQIDDVIVVKLSN